MKSSQNTPKSQTTSQPFISHTTHIYIVLQVDQLMPRPVEIWEVQPAQRALCCSNLDREKDQLGLRFSMQIRRSPFLEKDHIHIHIIASLYSRNGCFVLLNPIRIVCMTHLHRVGPMCSVSRTLIYRGMSQCPNVPVSHGDGLNEKAVRSLLRPNTN